MKNIQHRIYAVRELGMDVVRLVVFVDNKMVHISTHMSSGGARTKLDNVIKKVTNDTH